jgi:hypothetical protein
MRVSVNLNDQLLGDTDEVDDVWAEGLLSSELDAKATRAQVIPQPIFGLRWV